MKCGRWNDHLRTATQDTREMRSGFSSGPPRICGSLFPRDLRTAYSHSLRAVRPKNGSTCRAGQTAWNFDLDANNSPLAYTARDSLETDRGRATPTSLAATNSASLLTSRSRQTACIGAHFRAWGLLLPTVDSRSDVLRRFAGSRPSPYALDDDGGRLDDDNGEVFAGLPQPPKDWSNEKSVHFVSKCLVWSGNSCEVSCACLHAPATARHRFSPGWRSGRRLLSGQFSPSSRTTRRSRRCRRQAGRSVWHAMPPASRRLAVPFMRSTCGAASCSRW